MTDTSREPLLSADRPITSKSQDKLHRGRFSTDLAKAITNWKAPDSLVVGLYGQWGSGKTSVKNLVLEILDESPSTAPAVLEFNPWQWRGHDEVSSAFFRDVLHKLGQVSDNKEKRTLARRLRRYARALAVGTAIFEPIGPLLGKILSVLGLLATGLVFFGEAATSFAHVVLAGVALVAVLLLSGEKLLERLSEYFESQEDDASLEDQKRAISEALRENKRSLLVVIDDVDRLSASEIRAVFQLIKANADFPRFIYLVLFERSIVADALKGDAKRDGDKYLEKIIQAGFDLPLARREDIEMLLTQELNRVLANELKRFDQRYWIAVYQAGLRQYFQTLRDVKRFLGMFEFHVGLLRTDGMLEVNPVDLIAIETLRVFEPTLHAAMRAGKTVLTSRVSEKNIEEHRAKCTAILDHSAPARQHALRDLLQELFPPAAQGFGGMRYGPTQSQGWVRELRACSAEMFDRYFEYALSPRDVSQAEVAHLLALTSDGRALTAALRRFAEADRLLTALERFRAKVPDVVPANAYDIVVALLNLGDVLPERIDGFSIPPIWLAMQVITDVLLREQNSDQREELLRRAIRDTDDLAMAVTAVDWESNADRRSQRPDSFAIRDTSLKAFQQQCVERIGQTAKDGRLHTLHELRHLLYRWRDWAGPDAPRQWVTKELVTSDYGALVLLKAFLESTTSTDLTRGITSEHRQIRLSELEQFVDLPQLEKLIDQVTHIKVNDERGRDALREFQRALADRRAGKQEMLRPVSPESAVARISQ